MTNYDFIGDVHGKGRALVRLLEKLGYSLNETGAYRHPDRKAVFVGDLVDRGPEQLLTVSIVKKMTEAGSAFCIMGNHEHNAIGWMTPNASRPGEFYRTHIEAHRKQHVDFLKEVEHDKALHESLVAWFSSLPIVLELDKVRVAHACFDEKAYQVVKPYLTTEGSLTAEGMELSFEKGTTLMRAVETITKGVEVELPDNRSFVDPMGKRRSALRIAWWNESPAFKDVALPFPGMKMEQIGDTLVPECSRPKLSPKHLHVFGHYWMKGSPSPLTEKILCLDYSGEHAKPLTCYRYSGEDRFHQDRFVQVA